MDIQAIVSTTLQGVIAATTPVAVFYVRKFMLQHFSIKKISLEVAQAANQAGFNLTADQVANTIRDAFQLAKNDILATVTVGNVTVPPPESQAEAVPAIPDEIKQAAELINCYLASLSKQE